MGILWGLQYAMIKLAAESGYNEINIIVLTLLMVSAFYLILVKVRGLKIPPNKETIVFLIIIAILGYILPLLATVYAAEKVTAGIISLVACLTPILTVLLALILRSETVSRSRIAGIALGAFSVTMVLLPELRSPDLGMLPWILLLLVAPLVFAVENIYVSMKWPKGLGAVEMVAGEAIVASVLMLPLFFVFGAPHEIKWQWTSAEIAIVVYVLAGIAESFLYFHIIRTTGGVLVSFGSFVSLFAGIGWGIVIFSESHPMTVWIAVIFLVVALTCIAASKQTYVRKES